MDLGNNWHYFCPDDKRPGIDRSAKIRVRRTRIWFPLGGDLVFWGFDESWSDGVMEVLPAHGLRHRAGLGVEKRQNRLFYFNTPVLHYSNTPEHKKTSRQSQLSLPLPIGDPRFTATGGSGFPHYNKRRSPT